MTSITLIQPHYPHGGPGKSQIYLPGGLMNLGSRLMKAGLSVNFIDLNHFGDTAWWAGMESEDFFGISVLGTPYIAAAVDLVRLMRNKGLSQPILVGGEGVARVKPEYFEKWFAGLGARQIRNDVDLARECDIEPEKLPSMHETSMVPMLRKLAEYPADLARYLTQEFALFLSQGCAFDCLYCQADNARKEQYRDTAMLADEIEYICKFLRGIGHSDLRVYISNLDAFQTPHKLEEQLKTIADIARKHGITPHIRCLATSRCTFRACRKDTDLARRLHDYGLEIVAFGADGADEATWQRQNKHHNSLSELQAASRAMENAGIIVELLMVIGFTTDGARALLLDLVFSIVEAFKRRIIRPYLAKTWEASAIDDPHTLLSVDYAMIGSRYTHPNFFQRWAANIVYLTIIALLAPFGMCPTRPLIPVPKAFGHSLAMFINDKMPFDR